MSTKVTYDFSDLVSSFNNTTSVSKDWKVIFNDDFGGVASGEYILPSPSLFGNKIRYDNSLKIYGSSVQYSILGNPIYTTPGNSKLEYVGDTSNMSSIVYKISELKNPTTQLYRSYDLFENISNKTLEDNYQYENTFIGLSNNTSKVGVVILKPPSKLKIRNRNLYVNHIKELGAIGEQTIVDYNDICESSLHSENERIISLVYEKNGKFYNISNLKLIEDYDLSTGKYSLMYSGSGEISPLRLTNIGTDGRKINGTLINGYNITSDIVLDKLKNKNLLNSSFYPYKEENTTINISTINETNTLDICLLHKIIGESTILTISVKTPEGEILMSNNITINEIGFSPSISVVDFSEEYSMSLDSVDITYSTDDSDDTLNSYTTKHIEPYYSTMVGTSASDLHVLGTKDIVLPQGSNAYILLANTNNKLTTNNIFTIYRKSNGSYIETTNYAIINYFSYDCIQLLDGVGEYKIVAHIESNTSDGIYPSRIITEYLSVYNKIVNPIITKIDNNLGSGRVNYSIEVSQEDNVVCYFSIDGNEPDMVINTYVSEYLNNDYPLFTFEEPKTIKAFAFDGIQKSETITLDCELNKTVQLPDPIIYATFNEVTKKYDITMTGVGVRYTIDGTNPNINDKIYSQIFSVSPLIGNKITIKAKSFQSGSIESNIAMLVLEFNYACSPWNTEYGKISIADNSVKIYSDTLISRRTINSQNYTMKFNIIGWTGASDLIITTRGSILDNNNYGSGYFKNISFIISCTYNDENISVLSLGTVSSNFNRDTFKQIGETIWNKSNELYVEYSIINNKQSIKLINYDRYVNSEEYTISINDDNKPAMLFQSISGSSNIDIGNINIYCR